jgi:hypothetical protein
VHDEAGKVRGKKKVLRSSRTSLHNTHRFESTKIRIMFASKRNAAMLDEDLLPLTSRSSHRFKKLKSSQGDALAATLSSLDLSNPNPTPTFPPTVSLPSRRCITHRYSNSSVFLLHLL